MTQRAASPASCLACTSTGASPWSTEPAPRGTRPARTRSSPRSGRRASKGPRGLGQEGPERGLWPRAGPGLDRDFPTAPSPFRCPQVYEGLKPSDKYEKPLDYRYGMGARDLLRAHMYTWTPHTASGPSPLPTPCGALTPGCSLGGWVILSPGPAR